jgi:hypothetical protein
MDDQSRNRISSEDDEPLILQHSPLSPPFATCLWRRVVDKFGIDAGEWDRLGSVDVLDPGVPTPHPDEPYRPYDACWKNFMDAMKRAIGRVYGQS